jgi:hypothetical protein
MLADNSDLTPLDDFDGAFAHAAPADRLKHVRRGARALRERMLSAAPVPYYRSFDLVRVPYPTKYGLRDAAKVRTPFVHILNRMFVVQFRGATGLKTLLVSASDVDGNKATPFFARLAAQARLLGKRGEAVLAPRLGSVESALADAGLTPGDVDYITYDHLHTQDLRRWLGPNPYFPRAKLLVTRQEWTSAGALLPPQRDWYCPNGLDGVAADRVILLDRDVMLGDAVALVRTPGHTQGNHSIAVRTPEGVMVSSENGIGSDAYAPLASAIPGVAKWARETGMEVVLNGNTLEGAVDQYVSMVLEKELAGPSARDPAFTNVVSSSELTAYWLFPGVKPTFAFGPLSFGTVGRRA